MNPTTEQRARIEIDPKTIFALYVQQLQRLYDRANLLVTAARHVSEAQVKASERFMAWNCSNPGEFCQTAEESIAWIHQSFFEDCIELTGFFLDRVLFVCELMRIASTQKLKISDIKHLMSTLPPKLNKLNFPDKLQKLRDDYGVATPYTDHVLSFNGARNCVVHRMGRVEAKDTGPAGKLTITALTSQAFFIGESGTERKLDGPFMSSEAGTVQLRFLDHIATYSQGERIVFQQDDLHAAMVTYGNFANAVFNCVNDLARKAKALL